MIGFPVKLIRIEEGEQTMGTLARNMIFLMKNIELGKKHLGLPSAI